MSPTNAVCAVLARWFDEEIELRRVRPNIDGDQSFSILQSVFFKRAGRTTISKHFKSVLKKYGYKLRLSGREVQITKFMR